MRKRTPESGVLRACLDLLAVHKIWHERRNTGAMKDGKRYIRFSRKGTADILATPKADHMVPAKLMALAVATSSDSAEIHKPSGHIGVMVPTMLWIECKAGKNKQSEDQIAFEKEVSMAGHHYLVVRDVNSLSAWLKEHGCI